MTWWGLLLFLCKLGRLRQLDYQLRDEETCVLANLNQLAGTDQVTLPVYGTLSHFLKKLGSDGVGNLRTRMVRQLMRNKVLDNYRLFGAFVIAIDATGFVSFKKRHCPHCLTQTHESGTYYFHQVLEAKLITTSGLAISLATEFIDNRHLGDLRDVGAEKRKQDCELKAFARLARQLKRDYPQTRFCIAADSLYACGPVLRTCRQNKWHYVLTFKPGGLPAVWEDFQALLAISPQQVQTISQPQQNRELEYRWVNQLSYRDSDHQEHTFNAIQCIQTEEAQASKFAWITDLPVNDRNVHQTSEEAGRNRWKIENPGFNSQKNGGYELEHVYGSSEDLLKSFYFLLQIAHMILQLVEKGSLLRNAVGRPVVVAFGSLRNIARRLLDCLRYFLIPAEAFATRPGIQIRLDTS